MGSVRRAGGEAIRWGNGVELKNCGGRERLREIADGGYVKRCT